MSESLNGFPSVPAPYELITADISDASLRVWLAIALHRSVDGTAPFPGHKRLAEMCHVSRPTVERACRELKAKGFLVTEERFQPNGAQTTNLYHIRIPLPIKADDPITADDDGAITGDDTEVDFVAPGGALVVHIGKAARDAVWDALTHETN